MPSSMHRKFSAPMMAATSPSCGQPPVGADEWSAYVLNDVATMPVLSHRRKWHRFGRNFTGCASPLYCCMPQGGTTDGRRKHLLFRIRHELSRGSDLGRR